MSTDNKLADYVLVPREPTEAMFDAGVERHRPQNMSAARLRLIWDAMLSAAPVQPPANGDAMTDERALEIVRWHCDPPSPRNRRAAMTDRPSDLKPCPFCGRADIARANNTYGAHWTMCNGCGAQTGEVGISSQAEADSRWNMRAAPPPTKPPEIGSKSVVPTAEHWRRAIKERGIENPKALDWIEQRARQMAKAGGAGG